MKVSIGTLKKFILSEAASKTLGPLQKFAEEYGFELSEMEEHIESFARDFYGHQEKPVDVEVFISNCEKALRNAGGIYESIYNVLNGGERNIIAGIVRDIIQNKVHTE